MDTLLSVYFGRAGVPKTKSLILLKDAGTSILVMRAIWQYMAVGYYWGSLVYTDLCRGQNMAQTYGELFMKVTSEKFQKWLNDLHEKCLDKDKVKHFMCLCQLCSVLFVTWTMVGTFLGKKPRSWNVLRMRTKLTCSCTRQALQEAKPVSIPIKSWLLERLRKTDFHA